MQTPPAKIMRTGENYGKEKSSEKREKNPK